MCLFFSLMIFNLLSSPLEEKVLILKAFLLERESLIWGRVLTGDLVVLGGALSGRVHKRVDQKPQNKGARSLFIEKTPIFTLGQSLTLIFFWASIWVSVWFGLICDSTSTSKLSSIYDLPLTWECGRLGSWVWHESWVDLGVGFYFRVGSIWESGLF